MPVDTMLAMLLPDMEPNIAEARTATLAGPPADRPARERGKSMKNRPIPERFMKAPR